MARSCTQSPWPVGTAADAAATSLRAWSSGSGLSSAARSMASAAAAAPPRRCAWAAVASSSAATCSSGCRAAAARCQARRSGWSCRALGELAVRSGAPGEGRGVVDGGADEGMGEAQAGPVYLDQAQLLGRREGPRIWPGAVAGCCAQVRAVGHGGQQQRGLRLLGQGGEPGGQDGGQPVSRGQRLGGPAAAGRGIVGDHLGQLDQRHGITGGLGEHLRPRPPAGRARLPVQQPAGVIGGERLQVQLGEAAVEAGGRGLTPGADQQHDPLGVQAAAGEGQRVQRAAVQPVGVVGDHQDRGVFGQIRQQGQDGRPRSAAGPEHRGPQKGRAPPAGPGPAGREGRRRPDSTGRSS